MYVSNLSQLVDMSDRQRREMDQQLGRLASTWSRRVHRRRRPAPPRPDAVRLRRPYLVLNRAVRRNH
jgi:hypothetical protein